MPLSMSGALQRLCGEWGVRMVQCTGGSYFHALVDVGRLVWLRMDLNLDVKALLFDHCNVP